MAGSCPLDARGKLVDARGMLGMLGRETLGAETCGPETDGAETEPLEIPEPDTDGAVTEGARRLGEVTEGARTPGTDEGTRKPGLAAAPCGAACWVCGASAGCPPRSLVSETNRTIPNATTSSTQNSSARIRYIERLFVSAGGFADCGAGGGAATGGAAAGGAAAGGLYAGGAAAYAGGAE